MRRYSQEREGGSIVTRSRSAAASNRSLQIEGQTTAGANKSKHEPDNTVGLVLGNEARGDLRWRNIACLLARSAGIRRNQNGRRLDSSPFRTPWEGGGAYTLSGFPIVDALLTQPPANGGQQREEGGYILSPPRPTPSMRANLGEMLRTKRMSCFRSFADK